jgi:ankyrin repeat protein
MHSSHEHSVHRLNALLEAGAAVTGSDGFTGLSPVHVAARCNRTAVIDALCEHAVRASGGGVLGLAAKTRMLNTRAAAHSGVTAVMLAAKHRNEGMVRHLLRRDADPKMKDQKGLTAATYAGTCSCYHQHPDAIVATNIANIVAATVCVYCVAVVA